MATQEILIDVMGVTPPETIRILKPSSAISTGEMENSVQLFGAAIVLWAIESRTLGVIENRRSNVILSDKNECCCSPAWRPRNLLFSSSDSGIHVRDSNR